MKTGLFLLALLTFYGHSALPVPTRLTGVVHDDSGSALTYVTIKVLKNNTLVKGAVTDIQGTYDLQIEPGTYTIEANYTGYESFKMENVQVLASQVNRLDITLVSGAAIQEVVVTGYASQHRKKDKSSTQAVMPQRRAPASESRHELGKAKVHAVQSNSKPAAGYTKSTAPTDREANFDDRRRMLPDSIIDGQNEEQYNILLENPYQDARTNAISTFSIDVDAASYANLRRFLNAGQMPPRDAVRIEEMVNYFDYDYPKPTGAHPFVVSTELAPCPWAPEHQLLVLGLQGQTMDVGQLPAANLVFLIDVSGSMNAEDRLPLVQQSLHLLTEQLRANDRVAIVVYAGAAGTVLESTPGYDKLTIKTALDRLHAGGSTAGGAGIQLAYNIARKNFIPGGNNRIILCTDGDFNVGVSSETELVTLIEKERSSGVYLTVLGYGTGNYQDGKMQQLADKGNGNHAYIDGLAEARKVLVQEFGGTLFAIAKDVKLQLHFNPSHVAGYRLIGYENRMLATEDFQDDTKDAGELGAGHRVTALYEIIPAGQILPALTRLDSALVTVVKPDTSVTLQANDLFVLQLRYKQPKGAQPSRLMEYRLAATALGQLSVSDNFQLASAVAEFGMLLRDSKYKGNASYPQALLRARAAARNDPGGYRTELVGLIEKAGILAVTTAGTRR